MTKLVGIILAAGAGTRLGPVTGGATSAGCAVSKGLVPTYDKPTIYYPLADMIGMGVEDVLIIAAPDNVDQYRNAIGDGANLGIAISYDVQHELRGIADAFIIGEEFIGRDNVALMFSDNIFCGPDFASSIAPCEPVEGAHIFAYEVDNPEAFGVVEFDDRGTVLSIEEKPAHPKSSYAVPGMYIYDSSVVDIAKQVPMSDRGELEISSVNEEYLRKGNLTVSKIDPSVRWFDTGTAESLFAAASYIKEYQELNGEVYGSPELAAFLTGRITVEQLEALSLQSHLKKASYGKLLQRYTTQVLA